MAPLQDGAVAEGIFAVGGEEVVREDGGGR